jgi:uncharacterized protein with PIN domain
MAALTLVVPPELRFLLPLGRRGGSVDVVAAATDSIGHVVQAAGIPLTEVGEILLNGEPETASARAAAGVLALSPVARPQPTPTSPPRFLLDVGLGGLARRLRILGLDAAYEPDADDPSLVARALTDDRVLLTQDRGLLRRRAVHAGALVRGAGTAAQLEDVLDRFAPRLAPCTRCTACGGVLSPVARDEVAARVTYREYGRCCSCGRVYWRGAHWVRLERVVADAEEVVRRRRAQTRRPEEQCRGEEASR